MDKKLGSSRIRIDPRESHESNARAGDAPSKNSHLVGAHETLSDIVGAYPERFRGLRQPELVLQTYLEREGTLSVGATIASKAGTRILLPSADDAARLDEIVKNDVNGISQGRAFSARERFASALGERLKARSAPRPSHPKDTWFQSVLRAVLDLFAEALTLGRANTSTFDGELTTDKTKTWRQIGETIARGCPYDVALVLTESNGEQMLRDRLGKPSAETDALLAGATNAVSEELDALGELDDILESSSLSFARSLIYTDGERAAEAIERAAYLGALYAAEPLSSLQLLALNRAEYAPSAIELIAATGLFSSTERRAVLDLVPELSPEARARAQHYLRELAATHSTQTRTLLELAVNGRFEVGLGACLLSAQRLTEGMPPEQRAQTFAVLKRTLHKPKLAAKIVEILSHPDVQPITLPRLEMISSLVDDALKVEGTFGTFIATTVDDLSVPGEDEAGTLRGLADPMERAALTLVVTLGGDSLEIDSTVLRAAPLDRFAQWGLNPREVALLVQSALSEEIPAGSVIAINAQSRSGQAFGLHSEVLDAQGGDVELLVLGLRSDLEPTVTSSSDRYNSSMETIGRLPQGVFTQELVASIRDHGELSSALQASRSFDIADQLPTGTGDLSKLAETPIEQQRVLSVGMSRFVYSKPLAGTLRDSRRFERALLQLGYPREHVERHSNLTLAQLENRIMRGVLRSPAGGALVVFIASHGTKERITTAGTSDFTVAHMDRLEEIAQSRGVQVHWIFDACLSGSIADYAREQALDRALEPLPSGHPASAIQNKIRTLRAGQLGLRDTLESSGEPMRFGARTYGADFMRAALRRALKEGDAFDPYSVIPDFAALRARAADNEPLSGQLELLEFFIFGLADVAKVVGYEYEGEPLLSPELADSNQAIQIGLEQLGTLLDEQLVLFHALSADSAR